MAIVSIIRTPLQPGMAEIEQALARSLAAIGIWDELLCCQGEILLKPNVGCLARPEEAANTDPRVVRALIHLLRQAGLENIVIAESSIVGVDTQSCFDASGFTAMAAEEDVPLIDLKKEEVVEAALNNGLVLKRIRVYRRAMDADLIINLPKLKTITAVPISLGMKNLKGLIPDSEKRRFHHLDLNQAIVDLNQLIKPKLTIIDGITASDLYRPRKMGLILAGRDVVSVDAVGAMVMGIAPAEIKYLTAAADRGLGIINPMKIDVVGENISDVSQVFQRAVNNTQGFKQLFPQVDIIDGGACSSCIGVLYRALFSLQERGLLDRLHGRSLVIGSQAKSEAGKNAIYIGNCLQNFKDKDCFPGCPPLSLDLVDFLSALDKSPSVQNFFSPDGRKKDSPGEKK